MLCHPFPPTGGAGVQRSTKFVKFLPEHGWQPIVLTVRDGIYRVRDESLLRDIPPGTPIIRTGTFEPSEAAAVASRGESDLTVSPEHARGAPPLRPQPRGRTLQDRLGALVVKRRIEKPFGATYPRELARSLYRLAIVPDRQLLWIPRAFPAALAAVRAWQPRVIYATGNPYSSFLLSRLIAVATRLPYVLDFRDPWTLNRYSWRYQPGADRRRAAIERWQESWALAGASAAIFMSRQVHGDYSVAYPRLAHRFHVLPNGFDLDDVADAAPVALEGFPLVHVGKLMPYRPPDPFLAGLAHAVRADPAFSQVARAYFVGDWRPEHQAAADRFGVGSLVRSIPYLPHREAIGHLRAAGVLLLIGGGDASEQPGKLFEYLAAERPIVAIAPREGAIADVLRETGGGRIIEPSDIAGIGESLLEIWRSGVASSTHRPEGVAVYDRRRQSGQLAKILQSVCAR